MRDAVLVTGGAGYLGSRLASDPSFNREWNVTVGVHGTSGNIRQPSARGVALDLTSVEQLQRACSGIQAVVHLAATNESEAWENPSQAITSNTIGTLNLIRGAVASGVKRFLYVSTAHVYGNPLNGIVTEQTITRPTHPYAISKRAAEDFVFSAADQRQLVGIVLRLSNGFGAPLTPDTDRWGLVVNNLCRQAVTKRVLVLRSSGKQRRDFIPMGDILRAIRHCLSMPAEHVGNGLFNVGGESPLRIVEIAELIAERCFHILGFKPPIQKLEASSTEPDLPLDFRIDKLKKTGFILTTSLAEEIDSTLRVCEQSFGRLSLEAK